MTLAVLKSDEARKLRARLDSFANPTTGIAGLYDKRYGGYAQVLTLAYEDCYTLYRGNDMAARIVEALPNDGTRAGWEISIEGDSVASEQVGMALDDLNARARLTQAWKWARAYGGAGVFVGANDGQDASQPLDLSRVRSVDFLLVLDPLELVPESYYIELGAQYGLPETYRINRMATISPLPGVSMLYGGARGVGALGQLSAAKGGWDNLLPIVHESRILRFEGVIANRLQLRQNRFWGDSVLVRCNEIVRDFNLSWSSAALLLQDFATPVVKMKALDQLMGENGQQALQDAAAMIESQRSTARAVIISDTDEYQRSATPVSGLPELLDRFAQRLAAAANMPVTKLMGESPAGLNATGQQDESFWFDEVTAEQNNVLRPALNRLCEILFAAKKGPTSGRDPGKGNWHVAFTPLKQLSPVDEAQRRLSIAQADVALVNAGIVTPEEVAATRYGGDEFNGDKIQLVEVDPQRRALAAQENAEAEAAAAAAAAAKLGTKQPVGEADPAGGAQAEKPGDGNGTK